jgi:uncharacterized repeat protein (TIGR01451 family)
VHFGVNLPMRRAWVVPLVLCLSAAGGLLVSAAANGQPADAADLAITKTVDDPGPNVGATVDFTITVADLGPAAATGVRVTDMLPAGLTFVSATPSQGTYAPATGLWTVGAMVMATPATLTVRARVVSPQLQLDTAVISGSDQVDPNPGNNTSAARVSPQRADLLVTNAVNDPTPTVGELITYTAAVVNAGPDSATDVQISDALPPEVSFGFAAPTEGSYNTGTGLWTVGALAVGARATLTLAAFVNAVPATANTADVFHADQFDPDTANNTAENGTDPAEVDVALLKKVDDPAPNLGDTVTFTTTAGNTGPATATGVAVTDALPAGLTFVSATPSQGTFSSATGLWTIGTIPVAGAPTLTVHATVISPAQQSNTATVTALDQEDVNPGNDTASTLVTPQQADVAMYKTVNDPTPPVGSTVTFTITANNRGPNLATGVTVTDHLPPGVAFVSATPSVGSYDTATGVWTVGALSTSTAQLLTLTGIVLAIPSTNTASITHADQFDPDQANNSASAVITEATESPSPSESVSESASPSPSPSESTAPPTGPTPGNGAGGSPSGVVLAGAAGTGALPTTGTDLVPLIDLAGIATAAGGLLLWLAARNRARLTRRASRP